MSKMFKVGDRVRCLNGVPIHDPFLSWAYPMESFIGKIGVITKVWSDRPWYTVKTSPHGKQWIWHEKWLRKEDTEMAISEKKPATKETRYDVFCEEKDAEYNCTKKQAEEYINDLLIGSHINNEEITIFRTEDRVKFTVGGATIDDSEDNRKCGCRGETYCSKCN